MNEGMEIEKKQIEQKQSNERAIFYSICFIYFFLCLPQNAKCCGLSFYQNILYVSSSFSNIPIDLVQLHHMKNKEFPRHEETN